MEGKTVCERCGTISCQCAHLGEEFMSRIDAQVAAGDTRPRYELIIDLLIAMEVEKRLEEVTAEDEKLS
jgi:hypothetical protein